MRIKGAALASAILALAGCGMFQLATEEGPKRPEARPVAVASVPEGARTAEDFDITTPQERAAAAAPSAAQEGLLGTTVASLGSVSDPGFWIETPLAQTAGPGRVVVEGGEASAQVALRPIPGAPGGGSRLSLSAMQVLGVPLTDLVKLQVYAQE